MFLKAEIYIFLLVHDALFLQHCRYRMVSTVCLACYPLFSKKKMMLDVTQDKGQSTANSPTFEIMLPGSQANKQSLNKRDSSNLIFKNDFGFE